MHHLHLNYTSDMAKALHGAHKVNYAEYSTKLDVRMNVEKRREEDYQKSRRIIADIERKAYRHKQG